MKIKANSKAAYQKVLIKQILKNDLNYFLKKHWKQHLNQLVYSTHIRKWKKVNKKLAYSLLNDIRVPRNICGIVNIMTTLTKHYDYEMDNDCALVAKKLWDYFDDEIEKFIYNKKSKSDGLFWQIGIPNKRKGLKEQKARGFIHINDFEDYNRESCYLFSNIDADYVLPIPFYVDHKDWTKGNYYCYHGQYLYGVSGWTRIQLPSWGKLGIQGK